MITTGTSPVESFVLVFCLLVASHASHGHKARGETTLNQANHVKKVFRDWIGKYERGDRTTTGLVPVDLMTDYQNRFDHPISPRGLSPWK